MIIDFNITNYCNAKCPTCKRFDSDNYLQLEKNLSLVHMNFDNWKTIIERNSSYFLKKICYFCGEFGDPLMHPKIKDFVEVASKIFKEVSVYTNGGLRRTEFFDYLTNEGPNVIVRFGIDGLTQEVNNKYRINVDTELAFKNMLLLSSVGKAHWDYTIFEHNLFELTDVITIAIDNNIPLSLRFNLRPNYHGINRIHEKEVKRVKKIVRRFEKTNKIIHLDDFWINNL